jgi:hypothetical protein
MLTDTGKLGTRRVTNWQNEGGLGPQGPAGKQNFAVARKYAEYSGVSEGHLECGIAGNRGGCHRRLGRFCARLVPHAWV